VESRHSRLSSYLPDEFLNNPELQLKIIEHKLSEYWQEALADSDGNEDVAVLGLQAIGTVATYTLPQYRNRTRQKW